MSKMTLNKKVKELSCTTDKIIITSYKADSEGRTEVNVAAFQPHGNHFTRDFLIFYNERVRFYSFILVLSQHS